MSELAFGENGERVLAEDFDYNLFDGVREEVAAEAANLSPAEMETALKLFEHLLRWQWQSGMRNPDGVKIRAIICCWIFLKVLRPMTLTQLAHHYGMDKQSLGRWVDQFKKDFPQIRTVHMRNLD